MQTKVTIDQMREYVRSLDERLINKQKYTDTWIDAKIATAYEVVSTRRQPFQNTETLDLKDYILDGTQKIQVDMEFDVLGYKRIYPVIGEIHVDEEPYGLTSYTNDIKWKVRPDNIVDFELATDNLDASVPTVMYFEYYYIPQVPQAETYMSADIYHMLRHGMEFATYESLRDMEKFQWAQSKFEDSAKTVINGLDIDIQATDQWNGGF